MTKITNTEANEVTNIYSVMKELKENGKINNFTMEYDEENKVLDVKTVPVTATEYLNVSFTLPNSRE